MPETTQFGGPQEFATNDGSLNANTILLARYKILGQLGGGGQGAVYQARDLNFPDAKRLVAIKEMRYTTNDPNLRASTLKTFQREANILATLAHPAIPRIYDFFDQNERAYLVMEYINGSDLESILTKTKDLPMEKIIEWAIDLCEVLDYLHNQPEPIIFRDMKPANIMVDSLGKVRLIDFGIAKIFVPDVRNTMIGTEGYSAPEQYKGNVSPLSDIYSLGATLHHVITRQDPRLQPPFSFNERPIAEFNESAPRGLINVVDKSLIFEPENRYQTCADMKKALEAVRYGHHNDLTKRDPGIDIDDGREPTSFIGTSSLEPRWVFKTEDELRSSPVAYRNKWVFVGSYDTNLWGIDLETGEQYMKFNTEGGISASPVVDNENKQILVGSEDYSFYAIDIQTKRINWTFTSRDRIRGTARVAHGHVFFGGDDGHLYALLARDGRMLWNYDMGAEVRSRPFVTNDLIIVGAESGEIVALELNGQRKWGIRARRNVTSSPFVDMEENTCYIGSFDGNMYALDASSGSIHWRFRTTGPVISTPIVWNNLVYFGSADCNLYAVNAENGREKWKFSTEKPIVGSPILHEGAIYFGGTDGYLYCLNAKTGREEWKFQTEKAITSAPCITEDSIIFASLDHTLYALPLVSISTA